MMTKFPKVPYPEKFEVCRDSKHWENIIIWGECRTCKLTK